MSFWHVFLAAYGHDFEITGGDVMSTFLGLQVDHVNQEIHLHMDNYVEEILREYKPREHNSAAPDNNTSIYVGCCAGGDEDVLAVGLCPRLESCHI